MAVAPITVSPRDPTDIFQLESRAQCWQYAHVHHIQVLWPGAQRPHSPQTRSHHTAQADPCTLNQAASMEAPQGSFCNIPSCSPGLFTYCSKSTSDTDWKNHKVFKEIRIMHVLWQLHWETVMLHWVLVCQPLLLTQFTANLIKNITDLKAAKMLAMTISHLIMVWKSH